jgi:hypothetical protein
MQAPAVTSKPLSCAWWLAALADMPHVLRTAPSGAVPPGAATTVAAARRAWSLAPVATLGTPRPKATLQVVAALTDMVTAATHGATEARCLRGRARAQGQGLDMDMDVDVDVDADKGSTPHLALVAWAARAGVSLLGLVLRQWQVNDGHWLRPGSHEELDLFVAAGTRLAFGLVAGLTPAPALHTCLAPGFLSLLDSSTRLLSLLAWVGVAAQGAMPCFAPRAGVWAVTTLAAAAAAVGGPTVTKAFMPQVAMLVVQAPLGFSGQRFGQVLVPLMVQCLATAPGLGWPHRPTQIVLQALAILRHTHPEPAGHTQGPGSVPVPVPVPVAMTDEADPVVIPEPALASPPPPRTPPRRSLAATCRRGECSPPALGVALRWLHTARGPSVCDTTRSSVRMAARVMGISLGDASVPATTKPPPLELVQGLLHTETRRHLKRTRATDTGVGAPAAAAAPTPTVTPVRVPAPDAQDPWLCAICHTGQLDPQEAHCTLHCTHRFHSVCLAGYVCATTSNACPLCRQDIITKCDDNEWRLHHVTSSCCTHRATATPT